MLLLTVCTSVDSAITFRFLVIPNATYLALCKTYNFPHVDITFALQRCHPMRIVLRLLLIILAQSLAQIFC